jgi:hypothetical protein
MEMHAEPLQLSEGVERGQRFRRSKELVWSALSSRRGSICDLDTLGRAGNSNYKINLASFHYFTVVIFHLPKYFNEEIIIKGTA